MVNPLTRRSLLRWSAVAAVGLPVVPLLAACGTGATATTGTTSMSATASNAATASSAVTTSAAATSASSVNSASSVSTTAAKASTTVAPVEASGGPTASISYLTWASALDLPIHQRWADSFPTAAGQGTKVVLTADTSSSFLDHLLATVAAGTPPDLTWSQTTQLPVLAAPNALVDLIPLQQRSPSSLWDDYIKPQFANYTWKGKQVGLPWDMGTQALYYNKHLFQAAGQSFPTDSWTWAEYYAAAQKLTQGQGDSKVFGGILGGTDYYWMYPLLRAQGGEYFNADDTKVNVTSTGFLDALGAIADQYYKFHTHPLSGEITTKGSPFTHSRVAMGFYFSFSLQSFKQDVANGVIDTNWDVAAIPKGVTCAQAVGGSGYVIPQGGKNQAAAWEALKYFSLNAVPDLARAGRQLPPTMSQSSLAIPADGVPKNYKAALIDTVATCGKSVYYGTQYPQFQKVLNPALSNVLSGKQPAKTAMESIAQPLQAVLDQSH
jgi:multiple sugar transport system substrate-binding protein